MRILLLTLSVTINIALIGFINLVWTGIDFDKIYSDAQSRAMSIVKSEVEKLLNSP